LAEGIRFGHAGEFPRTEALAGCSAILLKEAALDRLADIRWQFIESFTLGGTARNRRYLGPITALFRVVHDKIQLHNPYQPLVDSRTSSNATGSSASALL